MSLKGKTLFITGASRGIGLAIALRAARDGANIAVAAKTDQPHPRLPGTIHTAAAEIVKAGGQALPLAVDVRDEEQVKAALARTAETFGGIDIVVNNASAVQVTPVVETDMKRYDLMNGVNARGTFMVSKFAIPYLEKAENPHILMNSPPLDMQEKWFAPAHCLFDGQVRHEHGGAGPCRRVALKGHRGERAVAARHDRDQRDPEPSRRRSGDADVAQAGDHGGRGRMRSSTRAADFTGHFLIDDTFLYGEGVRDFDQYRVDPTQPLEVVFFIPTRTTAATGRCH